QHRTRGPAPPNFFKKPARRVIFQSFPPIPAELTRNSQPIRTRPTSRKASVVLAAMGSALDSDGCDDSLVWTDMVFPLDASFALPILLPSRLNRDLDGRIMRL